MPVVNITTRSGKTHAIDQNDFFKRYQNYVTDNDGAVVDMYDKDGNMSKVSLGGARDKYRAGYRYQKPVVQKSEQKDESIGTKAKRMISGWFGSNEEEKPVTTQPKTPTTTSKPSQVKIGVDSPQIKQVAPVEIPQVQTPQAKQSTANSKTQQKMSKAEMEQFMQGAEDIKIGAQATQDYNKKSVEQTIKKAEKPFDVGKTNITQPKNDYLGDALQKEVARKTEEDKYKAAEGYVPQAMRAVQGGIADSIGTAFEGIIKDASDKYNASLQKGLGGTSIEDVFGGDQQANRDFWKETSPEKMQNIVDNLNINGIASSALYKGNTGNYQDWVINGAKSAEMDVDKYVRYVAMPSIARTAQAELEKKVAGRYKVKNYTDYFVKKMATGLMTADAMGSEQYQMMQSGVTDYEKNLNWLGKTGGFVATGTGDAPLMIAGGAVGNMTLKGVATGLKAAGARIALNEVIPGIASKILTRAGETLAPSVIEKGGQKMAHWYERAALANLTKPQWYAQKLSQGVISGSANMGTFEGLSSMRDHISYGGDMSGSALLGAFVLGAKTTDENGNEVRQGGFLHGAKTGGILGTVTPLGHYMSGVSNTALKSMAATVGSKAMEAALFTGLDYLSASEKEKANFDITEKFMDNSAMVVGFAFSGNPGGFINGAVRGTLAGVKGIAHPIDAWRALNRDNGGVRGYAMSEDHKEYMKQLFPNSTIFSLLDHRTSMNGKEGAAEREFQAIFNNPQLVPWTVRQKIGGGVFGVIEPVRPLTSKTEIGNGWLKLYAEDGELIDVVRYDNAEELRAAIDADKIERTHSVAQNIFTQYEFKELPENIKKKYTDTFNDVAKRNGMESDDLTALLLRNDPMHMNDNERTAVKDFVASIKDVDKEANDGVASPEQSSENGREAAETSGLAGENPNVGPLNNINTKIAQGEKNVADAKSSLAEFLDGEGAYLKDAGFTADNVTPETIQNLQGKTMSDAHMEMFLNVLKAENNLGNARVEKEAFVNKTADEINEKVDTWFAGVGHKGNVTMGEETRATNGDVAIMGEVNGKRVYILDGDYVDGEGMKAGESGMIICRDEEGNVETVSAEEIKNAVVVDKATICDPMRIAEQERVTAENPGLLNENDAAEQHRTEQQEAVGEGKSPESLTEEGKTAEGESVVAEQPRTETTGEAVGTEVVTENDTTAQTAYDRIPKDEKTGKAKWEEANEADTYDAIIEKSGGDEKRGHRMIANMLKATEENLKKAQKAVEKGAKASDDMDKMIAEEEALQAALEQAQARNEYWKKVAGEPERRRMEAEDKAEAERKAQEEEARLKAQEEANKVPDVVNDTPEDARKRGYKMVNGEKVERQGIMQGIVGRVANVIFGKGKNDRVQGVMMLAELDKVQQAHKGGGLNPLHFNPEVQPKDRTRTDSIVAAKTNAQPGTFDPRLVTGDGVAYTESAPIANTRWELIQGHGRKDMMEEVYATPESAALYKQYLKDHAEEFGFKPEDVDKLEKPFLINVIDVDDKEAIRLGQLTNSDLESGGTERIKPENTVKKMGDKFENFVHILMRGDEDMSVAQLIDENGIEAVKWMNKLGYITNTQLESAIKDGKLTAEGKNDLTNLLKQRLFENAPQALTQQFEALPAKAQKAILANYLRDMRVPEEAGLLGDIRQSVQAFSDLMQNADFAKATKYEDAIKAINNWLREQNAFENVQNSEKYSTFALELAARLKTSTQKGMSQIFDEYYTLVGDKKANAELGMFDEEGANEVLTKAEAIKKLFNIEINNDNKLQGGNDLAGNGESGTEGQRGGTGDGASGEPTATGEGTSDNRGGTGSDGGEGKGEVGSDLEKEYAAYLPNSKEKMRGEPEIIEEIAKNYFGGDFDKARDAVDAWKKEQIDKKTALGWIFASHGFDVTKLEGINKDTPVDEVAEQLPHTLSEKAKTKFDKLVESVFKYGSRESSSIPRKSAYPSEAKVFDELCDELPFQYGSHIAGAGVNSKSAKSLFYFDKETNTLYHIELQKSGYKSDRSAGEFYVTKTEFKPSGEAEGTVADVKHYVGKDSTTQPIAMAASDWENSKKTLADAITFLRRFETQTYEDVKSDYTDRYMVDGDEAKTIQKVEDIIKNNVEVGNFKKVGEEEASEARKKYLGVEEQGAEKANVDKNYSELHDEVKGVLDKFYDNFVNDTINDRKSLRDILQKKLNITLDQADSYLERYEEERGWQKDVDEYDDAVQNIDKYRKEAQDSAKSLAEELNPTENSKDTKARMAKIEEVIDEDSSRRSLMSRVKSLAEYIEQVLDEHSDVIDNIGEIEDESLNGIKEHLDSAETIKDELYDWLETIRDAANDDKEDYANDLRDYLNEITTDGNELDLAKVLNILEKVQDSGEKINNVWDAFDAVKDKEALIEDGKADADYAREQLAEVKKNVGEEKKGKEVSASDADVKTAEGAKVKIEGNKVKGKYGEYDLKTAREDHQIETEDGGYRDPSDEELIKAIEEEEAEMLKAVGGNIPEGLSYTGRTEFWGDNGEPDEGYAFIDKDGNEFVVSGDGKAWQVNTENNDVYDRLSKETYSSLDEAKAELKQAKTRVETFNNLSKEAKAIVEDYFYDYKNTKESKKKGLEILDDLSNGKITEDDILKKHNEEQLKEVSDEAKSVLATVTDEVKNKVLSRLSTEVNGVFNGYIPRFKVTFTDSEHKAYADAARDKIVFARLAKETGNKPYEAKAKEASEKMDAIVKDAKARTEREKADFEKKNSELIGKYNVGDRYVGKDGMVYVVTGKKDKTNRLKVKGVGKSTFEEVAPASIEGIKVITSAEYEKMKSDGYAEQKAKIAAFFSKPENKGITAEQIEEQIKRDKASLKEYKKGNKYPDEVYIKRMEAQIAACEEALKKAPKGGKKSGKKLYAFPGINNIDTENVDYDNLRSLPGVSFDDKGEHITGLNELLKECNDELKEIALRNGVRSVLSYLGMDKAKRLFGLMDGSDKERAEILRERISKIETEKKRRRIYAEGLSKKYNIDSKGNISLADLKRMFNDFNGDETRRELFDKILSVAEKRNPNIRFRNILLGGSAGGYSSPWNSVRYSFDFFSAKSNEERANAIIHELLHNTTTGITRYARGRFAKFFATDDVIKAVKTLDVISKAIKEKYPDIYASTDVYETIAEITDRELLDALGDISIDGLTGKDALIGTLYEICGDKRAIDVIFESVETLIAHDNSRANKLNYATYIIGKFVERLSESIKSAASRLPFVNEIIGKKRKTEMDSQLAKKRPDMSEEQRKQTIEAIEKLGEKVKEGGDPKTEKLAQHWVLKGNLILPEDEYKLLDAMEVAQKKGIDPFSYDNPTQLLMENSDVKPSVKPVNPDNVKVFSNKKELPNGVTVYDVEDTKEGQKAVREIIDTHWGEDANPWCLAARHGAEDTNLDSAWSMWEHYNAKQKKIAFKDGKLLAFHATDDAGRTEWWDRVDSPHEGFEIKTKREDGKTETRIMTEDGKVGEITKVSKGNENDGVYDEWDAKGNHTKHQEKKNGKIVGDLVEVDRAIEDFPAFRINRYDDKGKDTTHFVWDVADDGTLENGIKYDDVNDVKYSFEQNGRCEFMNEYLGSADENTLMHKAFIGNGGNGIVDIGDGRGKNLRLTFDENGKLVSIESKWHVNGHTARETYSPEEVSFGGLKAHAFGSEKAEKLIKEYLDGTRDFNDNKKIFDRESEEYRKLLDKYPENEWTKTDQNSYKTQIEEAGLDVNTLDDMFEGRSGADYAKRGYEKAMKGEALSSIEGMALMEAIKERGENAKFDADMKIFGIDKEDIGIYGSHEMNDKQAIAYRALEKYEAGRMLSRDEREVLEEIADKKFNDFDEGIRLRNGETEAEMELFHGSGQMFEEFDTDFAYSGAGSEVYGHGVYVTQDEATGRSYATISADKNHDASLTKPAREWLEKYKTFEDYKKDNADATQAEYLQAKKVKLRESGRVLYKVRVPEDNGSNYLEWGKKYEQGEELDNLIDKVSEKMREAGVDENTVLSFGDWKRNAEKATFGAIYKELEGAVGAKKASEIMSEIGYDGVKVPTGYTRGGGVEGKYNYVIFDADKARIVDAERFRRPEQSKVADQLRTQPAKEAPKTEAEATESSKKIAENGTAIVEKLGGKGKVHTSMETLDAKGQKVLAENPKAMGWYDTKTKEVHIIAWNCPSEVEMERTILHEKVGHEGLRKVMGEDGYKKFLRGVWEVLDGADRKAIQEKAQRNGWNFEEAIDEYMAEKAEDYGTEREGAKPTTLWQKVKDVMRDVLGAMGFKQTMTEKDVVKALWLSKHAMENKTGNLEYMIKKRAFENKLKRFEPKEETSRDEERWSQIESASDKDGKTAEKIDDIAYRTAKDENKLTPYGKAVRRKYEEAIKAVNFLWTEAHQNALKSLDIVQNLVAGGKENIKDADNALWALNRLGSKNQQEQGRFEREVVKPLNETVKKVMTYFDGKDSNARYDEMEQYVGAKTGLERNRVLFVKKSLAKNEDAESLGQDFQTEKQRLYNELANGNITYRDYIEGMDKWIVDNLDAEYKAGEHDYSGLSDYRKAGNEEEYRFGDGKTYDDKAVLDHVMNCEGKMGKDVVDGLWSDLRRLTDYSLQKDYECGITSKKQNGNAKEMFNFYMPLRGFAEDTAEDTWTYMNTGGHGRGVSTMKKTEGRITEAKHPIATAIAMGDASIMRGNRNTAKQALLRLVRANENDLIRETQVYYEKSVDPNTGEETLTALYPKFEDGMSADEIANAQEAFMQNIESMKAMGIDIVSEAQRGNMQPLRVVNAKDLDEHCIRVKVNGQTKTLMVFGHPRVAQAVNGMLVNSDWGAVGRKLKSLNSYMSQLNTSYSLTFIARNAARDLEFATVSMEATEGSKYTKQFVKNYASLGNKAAKNMLGKHREDAKHQSMVTLFAKYKAGTLDTNDYVQAKFKEFVDNGGVTGYVQLRDVDVWQKKMDKMVKGLNPKKPTKVGKEFVVNAIKAYGEGVATINEAIENQTRFAAYLTSRQNDRSIARSINDAKEVSVNFNKTGAGSATLSMRYKGETGWHYLNRVLAGGSASYLKNTTIFYNAGVQGMARAYNVVAGGDKRQTMKAVAGFCAAPFTMGMMLPLMNGAIASLIDNDDDKKKYGENPYYQLPSYERQQNVCMYIGHGRWLKLPMAIELRAMMGIGDLAAGWTYAPELRSTKVTNPESKMAVISNATEEVIEQLAQITPTDIFGGSKVGWNDWKGGIAGVVVPSAVQAPLAMATNVGWTGTPISRDNAFNGNDPEWTKATAKTKPGYTQLTKNLSNITGGTNVEAGFVDLNPAKMQYLIEQTLGGPGKDITGALTELVSGVADGDVQLDDIPVLKGVYRSSTPDNSMSVAKARYYAYVKEASKTDDIISGYKKDGKTNVDSKARYHALQESPAGRRAKVITKMNNKVKELQAKMKNAKTREDKGEIQEKINTYMKHAVDMMDLIEENRKKGRSLKEGVTTKVK